MSKELGTYKKMSQEIFQSVGKAIGVHVILLVVEHALWKTKHKYEEAGMITFSEDGISMDKLEELDEERAKLVAYEFTMSIVNTLGRLVGKQLANQLTKQLKLGEE